MLKKNRKQKLISKREIRKLPTHVINSNELASYCIYRLRDDPPKNITPPKCE